LICKGFSRLRKMRAAQASAGAVDKCAASAHIMWTTLCAIALPASKVFDSQGKNPTAQNTGIAGFHTEIAPKPGSDHSFKIAIG
jgi:hypothetical protein